MKMLEDFPFMRDHLHKFQPCDHDELHFCLSKAFEDGLDKGAVALLASPAMPAKSDASQ